MRNLSEPEQKMSDWNNELRFHSTDYSDRQVVDSARQAIDFAYENFKEPETVLEGYSYEYEGRITNVALGIDSHLQKNQSNKKSLFIRQFVLDVIGNEKWGKGRCGFLYLLYILKMDNELKDIAICRSDFWETPRINFQLLYALYRRKVYGFSNQAQLLIDRYPKETELRKYAKKYIENENKNRLS